MVKIDPIVHLELADALRCLCDEIESTGPLSEALAGAVERGRRACAGIEVDWDKVVGREEW